MRTLTLRAVSPYPRHPLLWVLTDVCGLPQSQIAAATTVPRAALDRALLGYPVRPEHARQLLALLERARDELADRAPPVRKSQKAVREYRRALFAVLNQVIHDFSPEQIRRRSTQLEQDIAQAVGSAQRRDLVYASLRRIHKLYVVRRALRRLHYREIDRGGQLWVLPPVDAPPPPPDREFDDPVPTPAPASTPLQHRILNAVSVYLGRMPDGRASASDVVAHVRSTTGAAVPTIYKAVRRMVLVREITGFGPTKRSTWSLPPPSDAPPDPDEYA